MGNFFVRRIQKKKRWKISKRWKTGDQMEQGFFNNKFVTTTSRVTERDRYESLKFYFNICTADEEMPVNRDEAMHLYHQISRFKNPKFRDDLFRRLEAYIGLFYNDELKVWKAHFLSDDLPNFEQQH